MNKYTIDQMKAIDTDGTDILVSAAAGSGKTAVLVERIMRLITKDPHPVDIDRLLVVTFTEAAAGEMRSRISESLNRRLRESPDDLNLSRQLNLLNVSSIMTIHAFCLRVVRQYFHLLDIDPGFRIADDTERRLLKSQVIAAQFEEEYEAGDERFFDLVESYGGGRTDDNGLEDLVLDIYEFVNSCPWPERWLEESAGMFINPFSAPWIGVICDALKMRLALALDGAKRAIAICESAHGPAKYVPALESDIALIENLLDIIEGRENMESQEKPTIAHVFTRLYNAFNAVKFMRIASYTAKNRGDVSENLIERVKFIRDNQIKKVIGRCADLLIKPPDEMLSDTCSLKAPMEKLKDLVLGFMERCTAEKKERNLLEFSDLEHLCLKLLLDGDKPSPAAMQIGEGYEEVLIDEYQDSNRIQELILSSLGARRFMVGDVKQSIYKFRHAMPEIFLQKYKEPEGTAVIDLSKNFRSRSCVLNAVNLLFGRLMNEDTGGIEYDSRASLYYGADYPDIGENISETAELIIIDAKPVIESVGREADGDPQAKEPGLESGTEACDDNNRDDPEDIRAAREAGDEATGSELEAEYIGDRILELTRPDNKGLKVWDGRSLTYRQARYGDIAVLVRSARASAGIVAASLTKRGIPFSSGAAGGFLDAPEIKIMLSLLRIIDNPLQDIHLLSVLRSPIYMLSPDDLLEIRSCSRDSYYNCVTEYIGDPAASPSLREKLAEFLRDLEKWRDAAVYAPIDELIDIIYEDSGFMDYAAAMSQGSVRLGNLRILRERAAQFEETSYRGLFHFMRYMEKVQNEGIELDDARPSSESDDMVRIMTIHGSKGLEFPIVFVCGLGRRFNMGDERKAVVTHGTLGFGPSFVELTNRIRSRTLPQIALSMSIRAENLAEELRVLYVAATRAREKLIFIGGVKDIEKKAVKWDIYSGAPLPAYYVMAQDNYLDWIAPALLGNRDGLKPWLEIKILDTNSIAEARDTNTSITNTAGMTRPISSISENDSKLEREAPEESDQSGNQENNPSEAERIISALEWAYPRQAESVLPAKITISEIKRRYQAEILTDRVVHINADEIKSPIKRAAKPRNSAPSAIEAGTALHTVLEHLDLKTHRSEAEISALVQSLMNANILDTNVLINTESICAFANSPLADRIRASSYVRTESPFVIELTPAEAFGDSYINLDAKLMLHGIIDCFFEEDGKFVLVDYKSDYVTSDRIMEIKNKYRLQLGLYARAIESRFGKPVKESLLYLFSINEAVGI